MAGKEIPDGTPETAPAPPGNGKTVAQLETEVQIAQQQFFVGTRQGTPEYDKARANLRKLKDELRKARAERRF